MLKKSRKFRVHIKCLQRFLNPPNYVVINSRERTKFFFASKYILILKFQYQPKNSKGQRVLSIPTHKHITTQVNSLLLSFRQSMRWENGFCYTCPISPPLQLETKRWQSSTKEARTHRKEIESEITGFSSIKAVDFKRRIYREHCKWGCGMKDY